MWWCMSVTPGLRKLRQEDYKIQDHLGLPSKILCHSPKNPEVWMASRHALSMPLAMT